jgi:hypothetical protein
MERGTSQETDDDATKAQEVAEDLQSGEYFWKLREGTVYRCRLSSRYHRRRERFYDLADRITNAVVLIAGSAAFAAAANADFVKVAGLLAALAGATTLVFGFSEKARRHSGFASSYKLIESEILKVGDFDYTEEQVNAWRSRIAEIESGEPPALRALIVLCQNDIAIAEGEWGKFTQLPRHKEWFAHLVDFKVDEKSNEELQAEAKSGSQPEPARA